MQPSSRFADGAECHHLLECLLLSIECAKKVNSKVNGCYGYGKATDKFYFCCCIICIVSINRF